MMRRAAALALIAALAAGCGGATAPAGFNDAACQAFRLLADTSDDWRAVTSNVGSDESAVSVAMASIEDKAGRAVDLAASAPEWPPGDQWIANVSIAGGDFIASIRQYRKGNISDATQAVKAGNASLTLATDALPEMKNKGLRC